MGRLRLPKSRPARGLRRAFFGCGLGRTVADYLPGGRAQRPVWSRDGSELFYVAEGKMMRAPVSSGGSFSVGTPEVLFEGMGELSADDVFEAETYDISHDGKRFIRIADEIISNDRVEILIVENWIEELGQLLPLG